MTEIKKMDQDYLDEVYWNAKPRKAPEKYNLYVYGPTLIILTFFGFPLHKVKPDQENERGLLRLGLIIQRSIWIFAQLLLLFSVFSNLAFSLESNDYNFGFYTLVLSNVLVAFISYVFLCSKEKEVVRLMEKIDDHWEIFCMEDQKKRNGKTLYILTTCLSVFFLVSILAIIFNSFFYRNDRLLIAEEQMRNSTFTAFRVNTTAILMAKHLMSGIDVVEDWSGILGHLIFCEGFNLFYGVLACHITMSLRYCFEMDEEENDKDSKMNRHAERIMLFKLCHIKAYQLIGECDDIMYVLCLLWVVNTLSACFAVYTFKSDVMSIHHFSLIVLLISHLICFVAIVACTAEANVQVTESIRHGIPGCEEAIGYENYDDKLAIMMRTIILYLAKMSIEVRGVTVGGLFNVERSLILTVVAAILTYSVIVYDMGSDSNK